MACVEDLCGALDSCSLKEEDFPNLSQEGRILLKFMRKLHCPFTWNPPREELKINVRRLEEKIAEIDDDEDFGIPWRTLILNLALSFEYCMKGSLDVAISKQEEVESIVSSAMEDYNKNKWCIALTGIQHVVQSTKCFLLLKDEKYIEAEETFKKIIPVEALSKEDQASVWGTRAALFMEYGYAGTKESLTYIERAIALDQLQGEWFFLRGKALGRVRRIDDYCEVPSDVEKDSLQKSFELTGNVSYMIFLAQVLRETAFRIFSRYRKDISKFRTICENMNERSYNLYKTALDLRKNCAHINIRCAQGFLKLPFPYQDMNLALDCINKALELAPQNVMAYHWAGKYYERVEDHEKALNYYEKADELLVYGATMDLLKLKWKIECKDYPLNWEKVPDYDPLPVLKRALEVYTMKYRRFETLCQIGSYYYFVKGDFREALRNWKEVIDDDPLSPKLQNHKSILLDMKTPVDICNIVLHEALLLLYAESTSPEDRELMESLVKEHFKGYPLTSPFSWREKVLNEIVERKQNPSSHQNRGHGNGRVRGRGNGLGRGQGNGLGRGQNVRGRGHGYQRGKAHNGYEQVNDRELLYQQTRERERERWWNTPQDKNNIDGRREYGEQQRDYVGNSGQNWRSECLNRNTSPSRGGENVFMHGNYGRGRSRPASLRGRGQRLPRGSRRNSSSPEH